MGKVIDLTGQKFGKLTAIRRIGSIDNRTAWHCICDCGQETTATTSSLKCGRKLSCGCLHSTAFIDLTGQKFGRLTVLSRAENSKYRRTAWQCQCDCGILCIVASKSLRSGGTQSCGCLHKERISTHGMTKTPTYYTWIGMIQRCTNSKHKAYQFYGGRGIKVCDRWLNSLSDFFEDMGERPEGHTLDRIDPNGNYEPGNCRWATVKTQAANTRRNRYIILDGKRVTAAEYARRTGVPDSTVGNWLKSGKLEEVS